MQTLSKLPFSSQKEEIDKAVELINKWDCGITDTEPAEVAHGVRIEEESEGMERGVGEIRDIV